MFDKNCRTGTGGSIVKLGQACWTKKLTSVAKLGLADVVDTLQSWVRPVEKKVVNYCKTGSGWHGRIGSGLLRKKLSSIAKLGQADIVYTLQNWIRPVEKKSCQALQNWVRLTLQNWVRPVEEKVVKHCKTGPGWHCRTGSGLLRKKLSSTAKLGQACWAKKLSTIAKLGQTQNWYTLQK